MIVGKITVEKYTHNGSIIVDAEPHVMHLARKLFDHGTNFHRSGQYTHNVLRMTLNNANAKSVIWFLGRFPMEMSETDHTELTAMAAEYDALANYMAEASEDTESRLSIHALVPTITPRPHQFAFVNMFSKVDRMLLADVLGTGKTISALTALAEPDTRPAFVVCPTHLCGQWQREIKRVYPSLQSHIIPGYKNYPLPAHDVLITSYNRLSSWQDVLSNMQFRTLILDEVQDLRKTGTNKRAMAAIISRNSERCVGLSGTPIFNYGVELWSVMDVIKPGCLGKESEFTDEWCVNGSVHEPAILNAHLKRSGLFLRRTPEEIGLTFGTASKHTYTIDADLDSLREIEDVMKALALSVLSMKLGNVDGQSADEAEREFSYKLRMATGVAKAKAAAQFVRMMVDQGEKVVLAGWHRSVYDIWLKELSDFNPVMYTGTESPKQKAESVTKFMEDDDCKVFIISLRSGAGLDGLQYVCRNVVFGELDWSPHVMDQVLGRVDRDGQTKHPQGFYLTIADGSDPFIMNILTKKRAQHEGAIEGKEGYGELVDEGELLAGREVDPTYIHEMAKAYLESLGEEIPVAVEEVGLLGEVTAGLRRIHVNGNSEDEIQRSVERLLPDLIQYGKVEREVKVGKRSRLDFLVSNETERVAIEIKQDSTDRAAVYRQVRKYVQEANITSLVLFAPWFGIASFVIDNVPVVVVDFTKNSI